MNVERLLQILVGILAVLGALMLGLSQGAPLFPAVMILAVVTAVTFCDVLRWFYVPRLLANVIILATAFGTLWGFFGGTPQTQLTAISRLLLYVQLTLLFQEKNARIYGHLVIFSLLQVVIASLLNVRFEFGLLLIAYVIVACFAVACLYLQRAVDRFYLSAVKAASARQDAEAPPTTLRAAMNRAPRASFSLPTNDLRTELMRPGLLKQVGAFAGGTVMFTVIFFYGVPRAERTSWQATRFSDQATVGFVDRIDLSRMVSILNSDELVMRATFRDAETNEAFRLEHPPYFRGGDLFDLTAEPTWTNMSARGLQRKSMPDLPGPPADAKNLVRQDAIMEPSKKATLFTVKPAYKTSSTPYDTRYNPFMRHIVHARDFMGDDNQQYHFSLLTDSIIDRKQVDIIPWAYYGDSIVRGRRDARWSTIDSFADWRPRWDGRIHRRLTDVPDDYPGIVITATRILLDAPESRIERARLLEQHFLSGDFTYSLDNARVKESQKSGQNPIEDFVVNHKTGHCELFASGLVLMLRSQRIPARIVVGYKGGEYNAIGKFYKVRQNNAHAWVEAYLRPEDMPQQHRDRFTTDLVGGWLRLDPTPASDDEDEFGANDKADYAQMLWDNYVLGLDPHKQQGLYDPNTGEFGFGDFRFKLDLAGLQEGKWFDWRAGLAVIGLLLVLVLMTITLRFASKFLVLWRSRQHKSERRRKSIRIEFYIRFEALLREFGWIRHETQTQREFAGEIEGELTERQIDVDLRSLPARLVRAFYSMRFGELDLTDDEIQSLYDDVSRLRQALQPDPS